MKQGIRGLLIKGFGAGQNVTSSEGGSLSSKPGDKLETTSEFFRLTFGFSHADQQAKSLVIQQSSKS